MPVLDYSGEAGMTRYTRIAVWETGGQVTWVRPEDFRSANDEDT